MNNFQICKRCVMDTSAKNIHFNEHGICNYCIDFEKKIQFESSKKNKLDPLLKKIRNSKGRSNYDCVVGRSGAKNRANITSNKTATVITPSEKKKVTVVYEEEKQKMANDSNAEQSSQEIPQFDVTLGRSSKKIKLLGISV